MDIRAHGFINKMYLNTLLCLPQETKILQGYTYKFQYTTHVIFKIIYIYFNKSDKQKA